ncbi:MAG: ATP-binding protein, partial [Actinomycetes bacterium]
MGQRVLLAAAAAVLMAAVVGVVTEYATATSPAWLSAWLSADPWRPWLLLGVAVLLAVVLAMLAVRAPAVAQPDAGAPTPPRFAVTPASLRAPRVENVLGRAEELRDLASAITQKPGKRPERFVVVAGSGGMGKTTVVARAVAEAQRDGYPAFWIRWRDVESLGAQLAHTAIALGLPEPRVAAAQQSGDSLADLVWAHLERTPGWVLVVDNLDQPTDAGLREEQVANYRGWIRPSRAGLLVLTSRDQNPTTWGPAARLIRLGPLDDQTGAQVLLAQAPRAGALAEAQTLSARLGGLPLALRAAAAVLAEPTASLRTFAAYQQALADRAVSVLP